jgi:hypothetical protein
MVADRSRKKGMSQEGEKYPFWKGRGGINIVFGPKYRPTALLPMHRTPSGT